MADTPLSPGTQRGLSWASLVLGILIFIVPFLSGTSGGFFANDLVVGAVIFVLGAICVWAAANSRVTLAWLALINALLGIWTIIAAYTYGAVTTFDVWANVILGLVLLVVAGWSCIMAFREGRTGMTRTGGMRRAGGV
jgi:hypothetical protein